MMVSKMSPVVIAFGLALASVAFAGQTESGLHVAAAQPAAPAFSASLRAKLDAALLARGSEYQARTRHLSEDGRPLFSNRLLLEKSPYLQQHAHNPVNWFPWGPEAFAEARRLGRPVFVSIGYSTCHWCHVMEEESFDTIEAAKILNAHFIAIKVDREARPDIDSIYMSAIQAMGKRGGWPLNMFITAEGKPFYGGTYFPPVARGGRAGFKEVLIQVSEAYVDRNKELMDMADAITLRLKDQLGGHVGRQSAVLGKRQLAASLEFVKRVADREWGGAGHGTKFPSALPIELLLRESRRTGDEEARALALLTLDKMAEGGIHDHLGGGFHRYATDARWLVPHFEKMLYDNALIATTYLSAFQATNDVAYERVLRDILDYVITEMIDASGGFYSATDADSLTAGGESEEGAFFTWTRTEVELLLGAEAARVPIAWYGIVDDGPLDGRSVLHTWRDEDEVAAELGLTREDFERKLLASEKGMLAARRLRRAPLRDDKILVAWNGLMVSALAKAGFALGEARYIEAAVGCANFVLGSMRSEGRLSRVSLAGEVGGPAFLEDYAFLIRGLIDLYEATGQIRWITEAFALQAIQDADYLDFEGGGYFRVAKDGEMLLAREKPIADGALPSGNSVAASNLSRLAGLSGRTIFTERLALLYSAFAEEVERSGSSSAVLLETVSDHEVGLLEVVVVEPESAGAGPGERSAEQVAEESATRARLEAMLGPLRSIFAPNRVVIRTREGKRVEALAEILPIVRGKSAIGGKATAYVCEDRVCQFPTNDPAVFAKQLRALPKSDADKDH
jgi:uncharacterized protein YyaL (SSP411 family)